MKKILWFLVLIVVLFVLIGTIFSWFDQPRRMTGQFIGSMYHERYEEAADMLHPPSSLRVDLDGQLVIIDRNGRSILVPKAQLPFMAGGHEGDHDYDFKMTALGPRTNGILHDPAVTLYLKLVGNEVAIEAVVN